MNEPMKNALLSACAYATTFTKICDEEIRGSRCSDGRRLASEELRAALQRVLLAESEQVCQRKYCGHSHLAHADGTVCVISDCHCYEFINQ